MLHTEVMICYIIVMICITVHAFYNVDMLQNNTN